MLTSNAFEDSIGELMATLTSGQLADIIETQPPSQTQTALIPVLDDGT
jgi:hypothetical protein